jgi:tetratricopeptide (TPR) repeat protein
MPENRILRRDWERLRKADDANSTALTVLRAREFLSHYPDFGPAWLVLGQALRCLARYEEAQSALTRCLDLCPEEKRRLPLYEFGHLGKQCGDYEEAARWYRASIEADPNDASGYIFLGGILAKQGKLHEAEQIHRTGTQCREGCIDEAFLNLGLVLRAQERFEEAAECFCKAVELDPNYRDAKQALRDTERCIRVLEGMG